MQSTMQSRERSLLEMAALAYGSALALALIILMSTAGHGSGAWFYVAAPVVASVVGIATQARPIVWTALGVCLAVGIIGFFSIGLIVFQIGICVFLWWLLSSRRTGRPVIVGSDLAWELAGFAAIMSPFFILI